MTWVSSEHDAICLSDTSMNPSPNQIAHISQAKDKRIQIALIDPPGSGLYNKVSVALLRHAHTNAESQIAALPT